MPITCVALDASVWSGGVHEETGLQRNGARSSFATNPDSISALPGAIFQQDSDQPLTARVSQNCLRTVITLPWPARSLDLAPIEHIWDHLGRQVGYPTSLNELEARLQHMWNEMSQDIIQNLYASMPDRIASYIRVRGVQQGIKSSVLLPFSLK
ncbi:transposable element Tcb1 transposase [Trichonephila clavipes]|nr:transposable element Tcb1 transposase [Trichonephila clavipes]